MCVACQHAAQRGERELLASHLGGARWLLIGYLRRRWRATEFDQQRAGPAVGAQQHATKQGTAGEFRAGGGEVHIGATQSATIFVYLHERAAHLLHQRYIEHGSNLAHAGQGRDRLSELFEQGACVGVLQATR